MFGPRQTYADGTNKKAARGTLEERIQAWVEYDLNGGCWLWSGMVTRAGYGVMNVNRRRRYVHRTSWELAQGQTIPPGKVICHRCDTPACCNPTHLFLGTHADNVADMGRKGRASGPRGERHPRTKLTEQGVRGIRAATGSRAAIARQFGVSWRTVDDILKGNFWGWLK